MELLLHEFLRLNAIRYPDRTAILFRNQRFTYSQFNARVNRLANALSNLGVKKGDKVAFMMTNCNELLEVGYAAPKIGAAFVPINSRSVASEIEYLVNDSDSVAVFVNAECLPEVIKARPNFALARNVIVVRGEAPAGTLSYEELLDGAPDTEPKVEVSEGDLMCLMYTGGTTGRPKGSIRSHRGIALLALLFAIEYDYHEGDMGLVAGPLYGAAAFAFCIPNLTIGGAVCILPVFHPVEALKAIDQFKCNNAFLAPVMLDFILNLPDEVKKRYDVSSMKAIMSVGAPLHTDTKEGTIAYFKNSGLHELYGASEHGASTDLKPYDQLRKTRCVGVPFLGMEVKLLDKDGNEVPRGEMGEFWVRGLTVCDGYYKKPEATAEALRNGWLGLGDMGRQDEEGYYYIVDRKKDMIISGALNIYPTEIEDVLRKHPDIFDVAVIGVPDQKWGEAVKAVVELKEGARITADEIIKWCENKMAGYKKPKSVDIVDQLPRTLQGKVLKYQLRKKYWENMDIKVQ